jgi:hypothetical protein
MPTYHDLNDQILAVLAEAGRPLTTAEVAHCLQTVVSGRLPTIDTVANRLRALRAVNAIERVEITPTRWSTTPCPAPAS